MSDNQKTLVSGMVGLLLGVMITYFGVQKLTDKVIETSEQFGVLKFQIQDLSKEVSTLKDKSKTLNVGVSSSQEELEKTKNKISAVGSKLKSITDGDEYKISQLIEELKGSDSTELLSKHGRDIADIQTELPLLAKKSSLKSISFICETVTGQGQNANCPTGYFVTGCSAGQNKGSISHNNTSCHTQEPVDWTQARCCTVTQ